MVMFSFGYNYGYVVFPGLIIVFAWFSVLSRHKPLPIL